MSVSFNQERSFAAIWFPVNGNQERVYFSAYLDEGDSPFFLKRFAENSNSSIVEVTRSEHEELVCDCIEAIKSGQLQKVVASRIKRVERKESVGLDVLFDALKNAYPNATVYAFRLEGGETWMGATPELLFRKRGKKIQTVALAGTQAFIPEKELHHYSWGEKEIQEQQVVTDYITKRLAAAGCAQIEATLAYTVQAGKLVHLKSDIRCESMLTSSQLVDLLHPTPAVCGVPLEEASQFIKHNEKHSRSFYAGVIGVIAPNDDADLFVNLRCMQVFPTEFALYLGGGIMVDSDPAREWEETELKSMTLLNVINSVSS